jgi:hypothetical protein
MKVFSGMTSIFLQICIILCGICCHAQNAGGVPDGFQILKERMAKQEIPAVDFSKFKFEFPDTVPDELNIIKGYLWQGQHFHPVRRGQAGPVAYLFLVSFNKETREISFFRAYEQTAKTPSGWGILSGRFDSNNNRKIDLQTKDGTSFVIIINDKDHLTAKAHTGYEAHMKKIGAISSPK